jgi:hypothetical protein
MIKMTEKEKHDWYDLCDYIKYEILEYSPEMKIPQTLALRLKGLAQGNFMVNKYIKPNASYTYEQILIACKVCKLKIKDYFSKNSAKINGETHKINLIMKFLEQEINDVVLKIQQKEQIDTEILRMSFENHTEDKADYKTETTNVKDKFDELW